jgi:hypothetical protein
VNTTAGVATTDFVGELVAGTSVITATAEGGAQGVVRATIQPGAPAQIALETSPAQISVGEDKALLRATVRDRYGNAVMDGTPVTFTTDLGELRSIDSVGARPAVSSDLTAQTIDGMAKASLASGFRSGTAHVRAAVASGPIESGAVTIQPGPPALMTLSAQPARVGPGGRVELAASVQDQYGNSVADGAIVSFHSSGGQLTAASAPVSDGVALTRLVVPAAPGKLDIEALCGPASAHASVEVPWFAYLPLTRK